MRLLHIYASDVPCLPSRMEEWTAHQLERSGLDDPLDTVRAEGGPHHVRRHLRPYLDRLRATGRSDWADVLHARHHAEL